MIPLQMRVSVLSAPLGLHALLSTETCGVVSVRQQGACLNFSEASLPERLPGSSYMQADRAHMGCLSWQGHPAAQPRPSPCASPAPASGTAWGGTTAAWPPSRTARRRAAAAGRVQAAAAAAAGCTAPRTAQVRMRVSQKR